MNSTVTLELEIKQAEARKKINDDKVKRKIVEWQQWMKRLCEDAGIPEQVMNMGVTADLDEMVGVIKCSDGFYDRILQQVEVDITSEKIGTCDDCAGYFDAGKDTCKTCHFDLNSYNKPEEDEETDDEEAEFTCDTCDCELDPNDLINGFHDQSVYQCADCFDDDKEADEEEEETEEDE